MTECKKRSLAEELDLGNAEKLKKLAEFRRPVIDAVTLHPLIEELAEQALVRGASDVFIGSSFLPSFKINGEIVPADVKSPHKAEIPDIIYSSMNPLQRNKFDVDLEFNYTIQTANGVRFRANAYHEQCRPGLVMRRVSTNISTIDELRLPTMLKDLALRRRGLVIIAGTTGSGKSTTMAAMLDWRNTHSGGHIVTIEDPVEYIHLPKKSIVTHREVGVDSLSWHQAVQSAVRQAADVICVGEVRTVSNFEYALQLAQTGHLCFFTLHAGNAPQALERILNFYPTERHRQLLMDLALNLTAIVGQRLVNDKNGMQRHAVVDLLINNPAMQNYIFKGDMFEIRELMSKSQTEGMQTFDEGLFELYSRGLITYEEALRHADSINNLRLRINLYERGRESDALFDKVGDLNLL